ncbi:unnamed protein product [Calicophoron daubneyi]|uniref:Cilia- and flagella-associated protein 53 n=1 Tax=Calicophoron daubneyi TaxID=300641 RepID=A0AAV2TK98_CALDB
MSSTARCYEKFRGPAPTSVALLEKKLTANYSKIWEGERQREDERHFRELDVQSARMFHFRNLWEEEALERMIEKETMRRFLRVKQEQAGDVARKKDKLEEVLKKEQTLLFAEQQEKAESARKEHQKLLIERAKKLEEERRLACEELARRKYEQQFLESCDPLRGEISKRRAIEIAQDRLVQLEMQRRLKLLNKKEEDYIDKILSLEPSKFSNNEGQKVEENKKNAQFLAQQIREKELTSLEEKELRRKDWEAAEEFRRQLKEEAEARLAKKLEQTLNIRKDLDNCLEAKRERQKQEADKVKAFEDLLVQQTKAQEQKVTAGKKEEKTIARKEALQYLDYVNRSRAAEVQFQKELEKIVDGQIQSEISRAAEKRARESAARKSLMEQAAGVRREQMECKAQIRIQEKLARQLEATNLKLIQEQVRMENEHQLVERRKRIATYRQALESQISHQQEECNKAIEELAREREEGQRKEEEIRRKIYEVVHSKIPETNLHPWRKLLFTKQSGVLEQSGKDMFAPHNTSH